MEPKGVPKSYRKGSRNGGRRETAKMLILSNPPTFLVDFWLLLGPKIRPKRLQNQVRKRSQVQDGKRTPKWFDLGPTWPPKWVPKSGQDASKTAPKRDQIWIEILGRHPAGFWPIWTPGGDGKRRHPPQFPPKPPLLSREAL